MPADQDYKIIPVALLDSSKSNTDIVIHKSFLFAGHLSLEKLEESWNALVTGWPILWARIRKDDESPSGLAYHIPTTKRLEEIRAEEASAEPSEKRAYLSVDKSDEPLSSYFPGFQFAPDPDGPVHSVSAPLEEDFAKVATAISPTKFEDYLDSEYPLMSIQVTRFSDATVITTNNSHIFGDGFTMVSILRAWQDVLNGMNPPPLDDLGIDPFLRFGPDMEADTKKAEAPPAPPGWYVLNWRQKLGVFGRYLYDVYVTRPEGQIQQRYIFLPNWKVAELQEQAADDLERIKAAPGASPDIRIGKSDVLYAWLMKESHATLPRTAISTPLSIVNLKGRPPPDITLPRHVFYNSALAVPLKSLGVGDLQDMPLGKLALHVRQSHQVYLDADVQRTSLKFYAYHGLYKRPSGQTPFFCPPHHRWSGLSDLRALRYFQLDFKGALPAKADGADKQDPTSAPLILQHIPRGRPMSKRDRWMCLGDTKEGTWFTGFMSEEQWGDVRGFGKYQVNADSVDVK